MVAGAVSANTIVVPVFNDGGGTGSTRTGMKTFIRVKNLDPATITVAVDYTDLNGIDGTPTPNTFELGPHSVIGWRPVADDIASEGAIGNAVPDALQTGTFVGAGVGGVDISSTGNILGMVSCEDYFVGSGGGSSLANAMSAP
jgi:hypothetical protein